jgi:uncharacterized protein (DUF1015 family)
MVIIRPFKGYRYDGSKVDVSKAIFPPYELSNVEFRNIFLKISSYNIIRAILGDERAEEKKRYRYSADLIDSWISNGFLKKDAGECIYVYSQEFEINGKKSERTGFISLVELEKFGKKIMPHEMTFHDQIVDMGAILENTRSNLGPIFSIYSDPGKKIERALEKIKLKKPDVDVFTGYEGVRHRMWAVSDGKIISFISNAMKRKQLLIADGHHRYNISLSYSLERPLDQPSRYMTMMMVGMENKGMTILPTHRLIKGMKNFHREDFIASLSKNFDVETFETGPGKEKMQFREFLASLNRRDWRSFGMYLGGSKFYVVSLKNADSMNVAKGHSKPWKRFGINVLHELVLKGILGIDASRHEGRTNVEYVKDLPGNAERCMDRIKNGECQIAFFMRPTSMDEIRKISGSGEMMPQKSTCFFPKIYSGVVIYKFDG